MIRARPLIGASVAAAFAILVMIGLGVWQLQRLEWKLALIEAAETRSTAEPVPIETLLGEPPEEIEYTHAFAEGEFLHGGEAYLFSQAENGRVGFDVLTPMRLASGGLILIDRGFVLPELKEPASRPQSLVAGRVRVTGLVRAASKGGLFTPSADRNLRVWYARNVGEIADTLGTEFVAPIVLAADAGPDAAAVPMGGTTRLSFRNDHLGYALTWFALAGVLLVIYVAYHVARGRLELGPRE